MQLLTKLPAHLHDIGKADLHHGPPIAIAVHPQLISWQVTWAGPPSEDNRFENWSICLEQELKCPDHPATNIPIFTCFRVLTLLKCEVFLRGQQASCMIMKCHNNDEAGSALDLHDAETLSSTTCVYQTEKRNELLQTISHHMPDPMCSYRAVLQAT